MPEATVRRIREPARSMVLALVLCLLAVPACAQPGAPSNLGVGGGAVMAQNILDTDSFGGSNGTVLHTYDANWIADTITFYNDCSIRGTPGVGGTPACGNHRIGQTWTNDQFAQLTVDGTTVASNTFVVMVRFTVTAGNGYTGGAPVQGGSTIYRIGRLDANVFTTLAAESGSTTIQAGDIVNLQVEGTVLTLKVTRGGSDAFTPFSYDTAGDATKYSTGNPGMVFQNTDGTVRLAGSWVAGSVGAAGAAAGPLIGPNILNKALVGGGLAH